MSESDKNTAGFFRAFGAVASAMFGVRRGKSARDDWAKIRPIHVIIAGVALVALFVAALLAIVAGVTGG